MISSNPVPKHAKAKLKSEIRISFFAVLASWRNENEESDNSRLAQRRKGRQGKTKIWNSDFILCGLGVLAR